MTARRVFKFMRELLDVDLTGLANGQTLIWNAGTEKFTPGSTGNPPDTTVVDLIAEATIGATVCQWPVNDGLPIIVLNGVASMTANGRTYEWPVGEGGDGAPPGAFAYDSGIISFTSHGVNYQFPATPIL